MICWDICPPCQEPCIFGCNTHQKCDKRCYELCEIEPCNEPCKRLPFSKTALKKDKKKKCLHPCIGLCGDICPSICRICDENEFNQNITRLTENFNYEYKEDDRFIQLTDCKNQHIFEVNLLDKLLAIKYGQNSTDSMEVLLPRCPICFTLIVRTKRYLNIFKQKMYLIDMIKKKYLKNAQYDQIRTCLLNSLETYGESSRCPRFVLEVTQNVNKRVSLNSLVSLKNNWLIFTKLNELRDSAHMLSRLDHIIFEIKKIFSLLYCKKTETVQLYSNSVYGQLEAETQRIQSLIEYYRYYEEASEFSANKFETSVVNRIFSVLDNLSFKLIDELKPFDKSLVKSDFEFLQKHIKIPLSKHEKTMIVSAMNLSPG